jgi:hypothetical protein
VKSPAWTSPFPLRLRRPEEYGALVEHIIANQMLNGAVIALTVRSACLPNSAVVKENEITAASHRGHE